MATLRRMPAQRRSIALLLAMALLVKLLVPVGWMPAFAGNRFTIEMCGGYGPVAPPMAMAMKDAANRLHGTHSEHGKHGKSGADQPCGFAALAFALDNAGPSTLQPLAILGQQAAPPPLNVSVGRGLAAPPPPATGPPALT